jgi:hypothetical protein
VAEKLTASLELGSAAAFIFSRLALINAHLQYEPAVSIRFVKPGFGMLTTMRQLGGNRFSFRR